MMHVLRLVVTYCFRLIALSSTSFLVGHVQSAEKDGMFNVGENLYPEQMAWKIEPGMEWKETTLENSPEYRKNRLRDLYEHIDLKKYSGKKLPCSKNIFGLKILNYYVVGSKGDKVWKIVDSLGRDYMDFTVFYSHDRTCSRQVAMENFIEMEKCMPHIHDGLFKYMKKGDDVVLLVEKTREKGRIYLVEKGGYCIWPDGYSPLRLSHEETLHVTESILDALAGRKKFGFFPARSKVIEQRSKLSYMERERFISELRNLDKSMSPLTRDILYDYGEEMIEALALEPVLAKAAKEEVIPNVSQGIGTVKWIKEHVNIPFIPGVGSNERHVDGITGTFQVKKEGRQYPVEYMIAHLSSQELAMKALFAMQARKEVDAQTEEEDIKRVTEMTQVHPGLVGDYDLCLKPVLNGLGVPIPHSQQAWICFVRGNTAVMLKSRDLKVSVLPLARSIDEALKNAIKLYETPEVIR